MPQTGALPAAGCAAGSARGLRKVMLTDQRGRLGYVGFKLEVNPTPLNVVQGPLVG